MKITRISCDKGNYTSGPAKGHLDSQMFPESKGTKYDRDVVKKTVKRRKKQAIARTVLAYRPKNVIGIEEFVSSNEQGINKEIWDSVYASARDMYDQMKQTMSDDPTSVFWNEDALVEEIKRNLISSGQIDEATADLAAESALSNDMRFRKMQQIKQPTTSTIPQQVPQQVAPPVTAKTISVTKTACKECEIKKS